jgi:Ca2+-binding RTX toxin-like protein
MREIGIFPFTNEPSEWSPGRSKRKRAMAINAIRGTAGNDTLVGTDLNDIIFGGASDDTIDGGPGGDKLFGEEGNDTFLGSAGADLNSGGAGIDTVDYSHHFFSGPSGGTAVGVTVSLLTGTGSGGDAEGDTFVGIENLIGTRFHSGDSLTGDNGNNILDGRNGDDFLFGMDGNDTLIGGLGRDTMSGGGQSDTFVFGTQVYGSYVSGDGFDVITDFRVGEDVIKFTGTEVNTLDDLKFSKVGNDTVINYGDDGSSITLVGVDLGQLMAHAAHDFLFV